LEAFHTNFGKLRFWFVFITDYISLHNVLEKLVKDLIDFPLFYITNNSNVYVMKPSCTETS